MILIKLTFAILKVLLDLIIFAHLLHVFAWQNLIRTINSLVDMFLAPTTARSKTIAIFGKIMI